MSITFGPEAAYAMWRVLVAGPAMMQRREAQRSIEKCVEESTTIDLSGSGAQTTHSHFPARPSISWADLGSARPGARPAATNSDVRKARDASLYGGATSKANDPRWVGLEHAGPDSFPTDVYPDAIRDMVNHAENWTVNGVNSIHKEVHEGLGLASNWRSMPAHPQPSPVTPIDHDGVSSGTNPQQWWDRQPQRETTIQAHRAIWSSGYHWAVGPTTTDKLVVDADPATDPRTSRNKQVRADHKLAVARGWTPPELPGGAWTLPEGTSIQKEVTIGHTMRDGFTFGGNLQQERTRKGTPRFTSNVAADPQSFGGNVPSPWLFPGKHVRISYTLQHAWADVGQADRFKVYDTRWSKHVDDPLATGGMLITRIPIHLLIMDNAIAPLSTLDKDGNPTYKVLRMCSPYFFEEYAPTTGYDKEAGCERTQNLGYRSYSIRYVLSHPTKKYPAGRVLGEPTRWGASHKRTIIMKPVSSTIVAQAKAMVAMGVIG
jgi:hypothetical protein